MVESTKKGKEDKKSETNTKTTNKISLLEVIQNSKYLPKSIQLTGPKEQASYKELVKLGHENFETELYTVKEFSKQLKKRELDDEFKVLYQICRVDDIMSKQIKQAEVQRFNRYCDILPFEDSRVKLKIRD